MKQMCLTASLLLLSAILIGAGIAEAAPNTHKHHKHHPSSLPSSKQQAASQKTKKLDTHSLYQLDLTWTRQDGKAVKLSSFRGKVVVIAMIYSSCPHACPLTISNMKDIERRISKTSRNRVAFVLVTFDPIRDTAKKLTALAAKRKLSTKYWSLLRNPSNDQILELSALLGVKYKKVSKVDFAHSNIITVLSPEGVIKYQQIGLNQDPKKSIETIHMLLKNKK